MSILNGVFVVVFSILVFVATKFPRIGLVVFILMAFLQGYIINPLYSLFKNMAGENLTYFNSGFVYSVISIATFVGVLLCLAKVFKNLTVKKI